MGPELQDRHCYGLGVAARHVGEWADLYRPKSIDRPLAPDNRVLKLPASFMTVKANGRGANLPGDNFWYGIFDASYTQPGDYIVAKTGIYFIASQTPLSSILCVKTNKTVSLVRQAPQHTVSINTYGGFAPGDTVPILSDWPVSATMNSRYGAPQGSLPTDEPLAYFDLLMPSSGRAMIQDGDIVNDDRGRSAILVSSEMTDLGWQLVAKIITS